MVKKFKGHILTNMDGTADLSGGVSMNRTEISDADYTALITDHTIVFTTLTADRAVTFPLASSVQKGNIKVIKNASGSLHTITGAGTGGDTVENPTLTDVRQSNSYQCDGVSKWTAIAGYQRPLKNHFLIQELSDFPDPVAGVITLETAVYDINGAIDVSPNRFSVPDGAIVHFTGSDAVLDGVTSDTTGALFSGEDLGGLELFIGNYSVPNGTLLDFRPPVQSFGAVFMENVIVFSTGGLGTLENTEGLALFKSALIDIGTGINLINSNKIFININQINTWKNQTTSYFIIDGTSSVISISSMSATPEPNETIFDIKKTSNINIGSITGNPIDLTQGGGIFAAGSKTQTDPNWQYVGNVNIPDSQTVGSMNFQDNATATTFVAVNTPTIINATWVEGENERFTFSSAGRYTYIGLADVKATVMGIATLVPGGNTDMAIYIAKNGSIIETSKGFRSSNRVDQIQAQELIALSTNDFLEIFIENQTNGTSITATDGYFNVIRSS